MLHVRSILSLLSFYLLINLDAAFAASAAPVSGGAAGHALGVQTGYSSVDSSVENVNKSFVFRGGIARIRYEFRDKSKTFLNGGYLQGFNLKNIQEGDSTMSSEESATSFGGGLHTGILIGDSGAIDFGLGYQPVRFALKTKQSTDIYDNQEQQYTRAWNLSFGLTYISRMKSVEIPIRLQLDYLSLGDGSRKGDDAALLRAVSMKSSSLLIGADFRN